MRLPGRSAARKIIIKADDCDRLLNPEANNG
jgi:hypothetical protein